MIPPRYTFAEDLGRLVDPALAARLTARLRFESWRLRYEGRRIWYLTNLDTADDNVPAPENS